MIAPSALNMESEPTEKKIEANRKAIEFLHTIDFKCIGKTIFNDHLATITEDGKNIGEYNISVQETIRDEEVCYLVHSQYHCTLDGVPKGASIIAYISRGMKTIDFTQHEYTEIADKLIEKKMVISFDGIQYIVKKTITNGMDVSEIEKIYPAADMVGFISDGATVILERVMCLKLDIPENACFITLDSSLDLVTLNYEKLLDERIEIDGNEMQTLGIQSEVNTIFGPVIKQTRFLVDGHITSQCIEGSSYYMKLVKMPINEEDIDAEQMTPEQKGLTWKEDMEMHSYYIERKEELINDHQTFLRHKPELQAVLQDFTQFLLLRKPDDIYIFAANYFGSLSTKKTADML